MKATLSLDEGSDRRLQAKSLGRTLIPPRLHQNVQHLAILANRTPQILQSAGSPEKHFIEMPAVAGARPMAVNEKESCFPRVRVGRAVRVQFYFNTFWIW